MGFRRHPIRDGLLQAGMRNRLQHARDGCSGAIVAAMTPVKPQVSNAMTSAGDGLSACASSMTPQSDPSSLGVTWRTDAVDVQFLVRPSEVCGEDHDVLAVAGSVCGGARRSAGRS